MNKQLNNNTTAATTTSTSTPSTATESTADLNARLEKLIKAHPVMCFIKGTVETPRCGFTKQLLALLKDTGVEFGTFDILSDQTVRDVSKPQQFV